MKLLAKTDPVLIIIGPSGVGKSTIVQKLIASKTIELTPTWTDRPPRTGEIELEHVFVSSKELDQKVKEDYFAHPPIKLFGLPYRYASPKIAQPEPGKIPTVMCRVMAMDLVDRLCPNRIVYQIEASENLVKQRLEARMAQNVVLGTRLSGYKTEIEQGRFCAKRIFMNDGDPDKVIKSIEEALRLDFHY